MCPDCGRPYGKRKRCYYCNGRPKTGETRVCAHCGCGFHVPAWKVARGEGRYCSVACKNASLRGRPLRSPRRQMPDGTRRLAANGYIRLKQAGEWVLEHRAVAEQMIGRPLRDNEDVHHINGDRADNRPENLEVLSSAEHQHLHEHWKVRASPSRTCEWCGGEYRRKPSRGGRFCSHPCYRTAMKARTA